MCQLAGEDKVLQGPCDHRAGRSTEGKTLLKTKILLLALV